MNQADVLIVEDDASLREALCDTLDIAGFSVISAANGLDALEVLSKNSVKLVVSDVQMANMDGLELLQNIETRFRDLPVLLMTAYGTIEKAVGAMQSGAVDYMVKPFEADQFLEQVKRYIDRAPDHFEDSVVQDPKMLRLYDLAKRVAKTESTVLIQGESGTGKEVIARFVHENSWRNSGPFIAINCAAIPGNMLEAVLFGYERGAFTGAYQASPGKFELAQGGTLLLDEVSEMEMGLQAKLLRVLQEREVERLGGKKAVDLDVRVVATTNRNLPEEIAQGNFRQDLYYRLNVLPMVIPQLKERKDDILPLANALLARHWPGGKKLPHFDENAQKFLLSHAWPGNVRELENLIQRALIFQSGDFISADDLSFDEATFGSESGPDPDGQDPGALGAGLRSAEEKLILEALLEENGSRQSTAERLGISPRTLRYKIARMKQAGVTIPC